jgi:hypothetical protein
MKNIQVNELTSKQVNELTGKQVNELTGKQVNESKQVTSPLPVIAGLTRNPLNSAVRLWKESCVKRGMIGRRRLALRSRLLAYSLTCLLALTCLLPSCEDMMGDFLEKAPSSDLNEDTVFSSSKLTLDFLASIYRLGIHSNNGYGSGQGGAIRFANPEPIPFSGASDESETGAQWYFTHVWNDGTINANKGWGDIDARFEYRFKAIRMITIMLDRADDLPSIEQDPDRGMEAKMIKHIKAEARVIRALNYLEMLKRYGGVPLIKNRLNVDDELKVPRSSVEETVKFIVQDCEEALPDLENHQLGANRGRIHKGVALAIKAKTLLYAASPLFNTAQPYMNMNDPALNTLICYGNVDKERWKLAAEAAKDVLEWAASTNYCRLITDKGEENYLETWNIYDNPEIILAEKSMPSIGRWDWPWGQGSKYAPQNWGGAGIEPTLDFVKKYETRDGTKTQWNEVGVTGYDLQEKMLNLDRRFQQTVSYNMAKWNADRLTCPLYQEAIPAIEATGWELPITGCLTGFYIHKTIPYIIDNNTWTYQPNSTLFQLNEFYLNYAEAVYEYFGSGDASLPGYSLTPRSAINTLRARAGQPAVKDAVYNGDFREVIRNERAVELAFDNHRFWDVRRWMIADDGINNAMQGPKIGIKINLIDPTVILKDPAGDPKDPNNIVLDNAPIDHGYKYTPYVFETRVFLKRMYLHPFNINEVNKGYLVQNPGY